MSIWIATTPALGTAQKCVVMPPASVPTKQTRSAAATTRFAHARELRLDPRLHLRFVEVDLPLVAAKLEVHRSWRTADRDAESLAHHVRKALDRIDGRIPLGHRLERRHVVDFLVDVAEFALRV